MIVSELMSRCLVCVAPEDTVESAARLLSQHGVGALPVCAEGGQLRGMITDRDIALRCVAADLPGSTRVQKIMSKGTVSVELRSDVREALQLMSSARVRRLPVTNGGRVVGMLALSDLIRCHSYQSELAAAMCEIALPEKK